MEDRILNSLLNPFAIMCYAIMFVVFLVSLVTEEDMSSVYTVGFIVAFASAFICFTAD